MARPMLLNAFEMNTVSQSSHGLWAHPRSRAADYNRLSYWTDLARLLERGLFDGLFLADVLGVYDVYGGSAEAALRSGAQIPINDPMLLVPAMAQVTQHLGFGITANVSYEAPFLLARRFSTLDHLTEGRVAWNVVTGFLDSAARAMGRPTQREHDTRYDMADDFLQVVYKLWEHSWADDAVLRDKGARVFSRPDRVREVAHDGPYFQMRGLHLSEPSPQRTPVLFQAGSSTRGLRFAGEHAECVFINGRSPAGAAEKVARLRAAARQAGRRDEDLRVFAGMSVIVGRSQAEAEDKLADYRSYIDPEGELAHFAASTGIDYARHGLDEPIGFVQNNANNSALESITTRSREGAWTKRDLIARMSVGGRGPLILGDPQQVADGLAQWMAEADIDGFNLTRLVAHESLEDFVTLVVPVLQERGLYKRGYGEGPLRRKLFGEARLPDRHPARRAG
ncbi:LLM class flavin-dependent oxidoreductase [Roseomonas sp. 18066]|uniref:LLM class flavin-dependent oxidoreductase n=1 Tax=Roseomonas sp. 18066 TaxID=2681412 RepID=UPI00135A8F5E|nr:LLM class flavin-dependent oxidoreductase [Roseomonas sp. 18066]